MTALYHANLKNEKLCPGKGIRYVETLDVWADMTSLANYSKITFLNRPSDDWDKFVTRATDSKLYHLSGWAELIRQVFGHHVLFVESRDPSGALSGILPVIQQRSRLLGNFATSLAFFNYGGALTDNQMVAQQLMLRAAEGAAQLGCRYLEFRDTQPRLGYWTRRTDKVSLQLDLPMSFDILSKRLGSKLRSQVKRAEREDVKCRIGTAELLEDFYAVFSENMRDLGTPVYPKAFFEAILRRFESYCQLVVVDWRGKPAAAAFLVFWRGQAEVPWAACRSGAKPLGMNMKLYWELLSLSLQRGCTKFDFGRSTVGSGTYRFKQQWGARPVQLYWYRWDPHGAGRDRSTGGGKGKVMQAATAVWRHLPLGIANRFGPLISGALPW